MSVPMTVALARRLVWDGVVAPDEADQALHSHVTRRVAFLQALLERRPDLVPRLEAELAAGRPGSSTTIIPDRDLLRTLPPGLCATLLAVPTGVDPRTGAIRILAADPSDPHIAEEFSYHLNAPVDVGRAPVRAVLNAVAGRLEAEAASSGTPAFGSHVQAQGNPSERPIPLVRVSAEMVRAPATVKGVAPQGSASGHVSPVVVAAGTSTRPVSEPIIELTRAKSIVPPATVKGTGPSGALPSSPDSAASSDRGEVSHGASGPPTPAEDSRREELDEAKTPEEVVTVLVRGLNRVARRVLVLAVRGKVFEGRDAGDDATRAAIRSLVVSSDRPSVLLTAVQSGSYLGPIPETRVHADLARPLAGFTDQIAVGTVLVTGRAALVYVMAGFDTAYLATRRAQELAQACGKTLERIVRGRRK
jgi:hypothetical protein